MIRKANGNDISRMAEINIFAWRSAFGGIIPDEILYIKRSLDHVKEELEEQMLTPGTEVEVWDDGFVKGYAIHNSSDRDKTRPAYELCDLFVEPQFTGQGIGWCLLHNMEMAAREKGMNCIILWTLEKNERGLHFYEKAQYFRDGGRKTIQEWRADKIRLRKKINLPEGR
ncbi:MAG: GNAT family N-acetyltransferase [Spirochaetales bacterium]|nr:GNAT family N-acetyltransferase [Spirochaetales bacterium]